jgi:hypothetical protein
MPSPDTTLQNPDVRSAIEGIYKICPTGLLNSPGIYFLLHRPTKRAYVGAVKSMSLHAAYLRGQFARCAKGLVPTVRLANMPSFDTKWDDWVFKTFPVIVEEREGAAHPVATSEAIGRAFEFHGSLLRKVLADKGILVVNTKSRVRGPNKGQVNGVH